MGYGWSGWVGGHIWKTGFDLKARNVPAVCLRRVEKRRPGILGGYLSEFLDLSKKTRNVNRFRVHQVSARNVGYEPIRWQKALTPDNYINLYWLRWLDTHTYPQTTNMYIFLIRSKVICECHTGPTPPHRLAVWRCDVKPPECFGPIYGLPRSGGFFWLPRFSKM